MRITAIAGDFGGCGFYRIFLPYKILARLRGHEVNASDQFAFNELTLAPTTPTDVVVVQRPGNAGILATLAVGKAQGIPVVAEVDDLLWNIPAWNPAFNVWKTRKQDNKQQMSLTVLKTFLSQADAITVSTEPLAREVRSQWPKKPVYVLPNCLAIGDWPKVDHAARWQGTERATVGWGGSVTHAADLSKVQGLPGQALGGMLHTRLYTFGWVAGAEKYLAPGFAVGRRMHDHWFPLNKIAYAYAKIDIGLAPLDGHRFNESKCIVEGTMVATADGWRPIEQVVGAAIPEFVVLNPVRVWTPHGIAVASHTYSSGVVPTIKVRTARGYEIEGTPDHRVMGADGEWRVLGALQGGDRLLLCPAGFAEQRVRLQVPLWHGRRPGAVPSSDPMLLPSVDITPRWAEFLGLFVGDGSLASNTVKVTVARQDPDLIEWVLAFGRDLGLRAKVSGKHGWGHRTVGAVDVRFSSRPMQDFLDQLGLVERTSRNRRKRLVVPECILRSPRDVVAGFLRGLFEADASVTRRATGILMTTKSPTLAAQVHLLLLGFGIPALRRTIWNRQYEREYQQVVLRRAETDVFAREVGLLSVRRQAALRKITERPHSNAYRPLMFEDEVKATVLGQGVVYDLHVPGVEAYYSGGFLSHNSALKAIEYGAVCTPTIATDSVTYRPFVRHGENGFLCKDTRDWLRALTVLATDHSKRIEMGLRARADAETMDIAQHVHKWEEVLMEVIARKRREVGMPALAPVQA